MSDSHPTSGRVSGPVHVVQLTTAHRAWDERIVHRMAAATGECGWTSEVALFDEVVNEEPVDGVVLTQIGRGGWRVARAIRSFRWITRSKPDLIHFHDPEILPVALLLRHLGHRVIYDIHDDYVASLRTRLEGLGVAGRVVAATWDYFERAGARAMNGVIVADRHLAERFKSANPVILGNHPTRDFIPDYQERVEEPGFNVLYVGGVTRARGLGVALEALRRLPMSDVRLHVVGSGTDEALLSELKSDSRVVLHGRVPWRELHQYYRSAHVGIALYQPLEAFMYSPGENAVKILEYMAAGIPCVTADFPGLRDFVHDSGAGLVVNPSDPDAVAAELDRLYRDLDLRTRLGAQGRELFETKYNWDMHKGRLLDLYRRVLAPSADRPVKPQGVPKATRNSTSLPPSGQVEDR